jgi:hypothetical protein
LAARRCAICGRRFRPDVRNQRHQRTCSPRCAQEAKRRYDRAYHRQANGTPEGRTCKRIKNREYREQQDWTRMMRYRRKADPQRAARLDRKAARRYYWRHRDRILQQRREKRADQKALRRARSQ